jgi:hypothetical protein
MVVQHDQYFSYRNRPEKQGDCIMCHERTNDWLAYEPPGMPVALERACCRSCINAAYATLRELADGASAVVRTFQRLRDIFGGNKS